MQSKILLRRISLIAIFLGLAVVLAFAFHFIFKKPIQKELASIENATNLSEQEKVVFALPVRLKIPKININTALEYVGLTSDGAVGVPENHEGVAWFSLGPIPGENGIAIITGHYGLKDGKSSAFDDLHKLRKGDKLYIENDKGIIISFVVRESRRYDPNANASDVFISNDNKSHLNLITCEGYWDKNTQSYSQRLVVFADKE